MPRRRLPWLAGACSLVLMLGLHGCARPEGAAPGTSTPDTLVVYLAASVTRAMQPVLDSFAARTHTVVQRESGASLEHVRKLTELGRIPDVLILADEEVFPQFLVPKFIDSWTTFARNRMVVAYTDRSHAAGDITSQNWMDILARHDVQVGRTDPDLAPAGYRAMIMVQLAERFYHRPGLAATLLANAPKANMRGNAAELAALLSAGELDYIYEYQSVALANGFKVLNLPPEIDLGDPARASEYATAAIDVRGDTRGTSAKMTGKPILYAAAIPLAAPHPAAARQFWAAFFSGETRTRLRAAYIDMLDSGITHRGDSTPSPRAR